MSIKKAACLVLLFFLLCTFLFPDVQGWWAVRRRRRSRSHRHSWQQGRSMSRSYTGWDTSFNSEFTWTCSGSSKSIYNVRSAHEYYHEDRVWGFDCKYDSKTPSSSPCSWKSPGRVNSLDTSFNYICPRNGHVVGMYGSTFNGHYKDREFNFKCCDTSSRTNCMWTSYINGWDGDMNYKVPRTYYLAGVSSYHNNRYEDRRWRFYICQ